MGERSPATRHCLIVRGLLLQQKEINMSIDKSKLPPPLAKLLTDLEAAGVKTEVITGTMPAELKKLLGIKDETTSAPSSTGSPDGYPPFDQFLDKLAEVMVSVSVDFVGRLHNHLCPRVKKLEAEIQRQVEITDGLMAREALHIKQIEQLKGEVLAIDAARRKQESLLHRRVTKRKGEIGAVAVAAAVSRASGARKTRIRK